ncbi:MAG: hypothetical protein U0236_14210 [Nitrospira sp.]|nr:hypothetical protein [Nitrospira sp.]
MSVKFCKRAPGWVLVVAGCIAVSAGFPSITSATHEADHRFQVEGYVCGEGGAGLSNTDVLVKDTRISYGQVVKTDGDGYYKAMFHLHNDNLGDPLLIEARGEQKNLKVEFDPKDLESDRKIRVDFGSGCGGGNSPSWIWWGGGAVLVVAGGAIGMRLLSSGGGKVKGRPQGKKRGHR